jgi:hypothetical protein
MGPIMRRGESPLPLGISLRYRSFKNISPIRQEDTRQEKNMRRCTGAPERRITTPRELQRKMAERIYHMSIR